jgi:hypothetical protein
VSNLERALFLARLGIPVVPEHTPNAKAVAGCDCNKSTCKKPGKHPRTRNGSHDATTDEATIRDWWTMWPHANIGTDAGLARLVFVAPDSPEWDAEFQRRGLEGAVVVQSGGGEGHKQYWFKRSATCPQANINKPDQYDIISAGNMILPGSTHASGRLYSFITPPVPVDQLQEEPEWVRAQLTKQRSTQPVAPRADNGEREPVVRLHPRGMKRWRGELVQTKPNGEPDTSESLYYIGLSLAECNASYSAIVAELAERDAALGWNKYTDRADDLEYRRIADKVIVYEDERRAAQTAPTPAPAAGTDGAQTCPNCPRLEAIVLEKNAEIAELRQGQSKIRRVLAIPTKVLNPTQKLVAVASTFELLSAESREPGKEHRLYTSVIAEKTGVSKSAAGDALAVLSRSGGIFERRESWESVSQTTGEVFDQPRRVVDYRPRFKTIGATFDGLAVYEPERPEGKGSWGGKRSKTITLQEDQCLCPEHPEAGSVLSCAACNHKIKVVVPADPERWRPSSQDDFTANPTAGLPDSVAVPLTKQLDLMGELGDPAAHGVDVSLRSQDDVMADQREPSWLFENVERIAAAESARLDQVESEAVRSCTDCREPLPPDRKLTCTRCTAQLDGAP